MISRGRPKIARARILTAAGENIVEVKHPEVGMGKFFSRPFSSHWLGAQALAACEEEESSEREEDR